jgi:two-component system, OmpR family, sensor histidine kinase MtrB
VTLRRRLTIAFALAVGVTAIALATGSYFVVRHNLLRDSVTSSAKQARENLRVAADYLPRRPAKLLAAYKTTGGFDTVLVSGGQTYSTRFLSPRQVPAGLRAIVRRGRLGYQRETVAGTHYLVVGGPAKGSELYFFFSEQGLRHELALLRNILLGGGLLLVLLAALAGAVLAREALRPVARASEAAHSLAEGLLETRLPVDGKDEFGAWAQAFNEMAGALETKIDALSAAEARERRFTADVAHELRTPLTGLVGEASLLAEHLAGMPAESRRPAELLISDVGRLRTLVEELMEISRLDAGAESVQLERVDLAALTRAVLRSRGWDERVQLSGEAVVTSDPRRLERILANLIGNALDHGADGVVVRVAPDSVEVSDHGPGIAPEHLPHLFERFYKADPSRSGRGSGLGLAIAQENARLLGGKIEVESEPGQGSRFTLRLSCCRTVTRE